MVITRREALGALAAAAVAAKTTQAQGPFFGSLGGGGGGGTGTISLGDFEYLGMFRMPVDDPAGAKTRWGYSYGNLATRRVGGDLRIFVSGAPNAAGGDYNSGSGDSPYEINYPGVGTVLASSPRATLIRNWGDIYAGRRLTGNPGAGPVTGAFLWDPLYNGLRWSYGNGYNVGGYWDPSLGFTRFDNDAGVFTPFGPWRTSQHSQKTRGPMTLMPQSFADSYTSGRRFTVGAPPTSGNFNSPVGLAYYALEDFNPTTRPANVVVYNPADPLVDCLALANYTDVHPQPRPSTYKACAWASPGACGNSVGSTAMGATSIAVSDTTLYAQAGSAISGGYLAGWDAMGWSFFYTGRSTTSGPGNLTGIPASGDGSVIATIPNGTPISLSMYDLGRGGVTAPGEANFNNSALRLDMFTAAAWVETATKSSLVTCGQITDIIPGHVYPSDGMPHMWYGPVNAPGGGECPHHHLASFQGTGPMADTAVGIVSTYGIATLSQAATGMINPWDLTPTVDLGNMQSITGASAILTNIATYKITIGGAAYDATDRLLFLTWNDAETIFEPRPVVIVFRVP